MDYLSLTDLFLVGLALDITGAVLLAKGLLVSPQEIAAITATMFDSNPTHTRDRCRNRVDGKFGMVYLAGGFFLQAVGYSLEIGGVDADTGTGRLITGLGMAVIATGIAAGVYLLTHEHFEKKMLGKVEVVQEARKKISELLRAAKKAERKRDAD